MLVCPTNFDIQFVMSAKEAHIVQSATIRALRAVVTEARSWLRPAKEWNGKRFGMED